MRRHIVGHLAIGAGVTGAMGLLSAFPAFAGGIAGYGNGSISDGGITATAASLFSGSSWSDPPATGDQASGGSGQSSVPPPSCYYVPASASVAASLGAGGPGPGTWYTWYCTSPTGFLNDPRPAIWVPAGSAPGAAPSVPALLQQAIDQAALVDPTIVLNPPGEQVVNLASWLAVSPNQWSAVVASATAGGVTTSVTATPETVLWNLGDGDSITCPGPGVLYNQNEPASDQSTYCSYTWPESSAGAQGGVFQVEATIEYQVATTVVGAPDPTPSLGIHAGPTQHIDVAVSEIEALGSS